MQPMEQQISLERVAEIMWQRGNDTDPAVKAHLAWLALPRTSGDTGAIGPRPLSRTGAVRRRVIAGKRGPT